MPFPRLQSQISQVFLGQDEVVQQALAALVAGGHVLLEGKPGLGKTHLVLALARSIGGQFGRIQFTPDLMPSDVTGFSLYDLGASRFVTRHGPVFANLLLADEINRAPAKTQASLLEVMQERQVTIDGQSHPLDPPFMVFATQNPIEHEGTYPLPEAQLDRFIMKLVIDYPDPAHEATIAAYAAAGARGAGLSPLHLEPVCSLQDILDAQDRAAAITAVDEVVHYAVALVRATRQSTAFSLGAGSRGAIDLLRVAKAHAFLGQRDFITPDDVKQAVLPVLRHRVQLTADLAISGQTVDAVLHSVITQVPAPRG